MTDDPARRRDETSPASQDATGADAAQAPDAPSAAEAATPGSPTGAGASAATGAAATDDKTTESTDPESTEPEDRPSFLARLREYALVIVIALGLSFLVKTFVAQPFWIPSGSMENTLVTGDRIVVNKLPGSSDNVERGDIVVFEDPNHWLPPVQESGGASGAVKKGLQFVGLYPAGDQHLVKRVIGVGGDKVVCCDAQGRLTVNGQPLNETYLREGEEPSTVDFDITVPAGKLWLMGDNRGNSADSREHDNDTGGREGSVPASKVTGKVWAVVWPIGHWGVPPSGHEVFSKVPSP